MKKESSREAGFPLAAWCGSVVGKDQFYSPEVFVAESPFAQGSGRPKAL
jgi:hypothetical protein